MQATNLSDLLDRLSTDAVRVSDLCSQKVVLQVPSRMFQSKTCRRLLSWFAKGMGWPQRDERLSAAWPCLSAGSYLQDLEARCSADPAIRPSDIQSRHVLGALAGVLAARCKDEAPLTETLEHSAYYTALLKTVAALLSEVFKTPPVLQFWQLCTLLSALFRACVSASGARR